MYNPRQNQQTSTAPLNVQGTLVHDEEIHEIPTSQTSQQDGGAYIARIDQSTLDTPDISLCTLQFIMQQANLGTADGITSLSMGQLSTYVLVLQSQIASDQAQIAANKYDIANLNMSINYLYQPAADLAYQQYSSSLSTYIKQSNLIAWETTRYNNDRSTLRALQGISTAYASTLAQYTDEFNDLSTQLAHDDATIARYEAQYRAQMQSASTNSALYALTRAQMDAVSEVIRGEVIVLNTPNVDPYTYNVTLSSFNYNTAIYINFSTLIQNYLYSTLYFQQMYASTFQYLSAMLGIHDINTLGAHDYQALIDDAKQKEDAAQGAIETLEGQITGLQTEINTLNGTNTTNYQILSDQISTLQRNADSYYSQLITEASNLCDEYKYGILEYNAQLHFITSALGIAVNLNADKIDGITFNKITGVNSDVLASQKLAYQSDNTDILGIINTLNNLDSYLDLNGKIIKALDGSVYSPDLPLANTEKAYFFSYIQARSTVCGLYEIPALTMSYASTLNIQAAYYAAFANGSNMHNAITALNVAIATRKDTLKEVNDIVDPYKSSINLYFGKYLTNVPISTNTDGSPIYTNVQDHLPHNLTRILADDGTVLGPVYIPPEYNTNANPPIKSNSADSHYAFISTIAY